MGVGGEGLWRGCQVGRDDRASFVGVGEGVGEARCSDTVSWRTFWMWGPHREARTFEARAPWNGRGQSGARDGEGQSTFTR